MEHLCICYADARGCLAWASLGIILFLRSLYYEGEGIGFRLFRATGLAFAIRPKDGVARQGRRGGLLKVQWLIYIGLFVNQLSFAFRLEATRY